MAKTCKICGTQLDDGENYCVICDRIVEDEVIEENVVQNEQSSEEVTEETKEEYTPKKYVINNPLDPKKLIALIVGLIAIIIMAIVLPDKNVVNKSNKPVLDMYTALIQQDYEAYKKAYLPFETDLEESKRPKVMEILQTNFNSAETILDYKIVSNEKQDRKPVRQYIKLIYDIKNVDMETSRKIVVEVSVMDKDGVTQQRKLSYYVIKYKGKWYMV